MNTIKIYKYILFLFAITFVISCEDDDTLSPEVITSGPSVNGKNLDSFITETLLNEAENQGLIDLSSGPTDADLEAAYEDVFDQIQDGQLTLPITGDVQIAAYVISNDEGGNFYEELIVQDKALEPTIGVRVMLNESPLFSSYQVGRKIYIDLNNENIELFLGLSDGVLAIGGATAIDGGGNIEVSKISGNLISSVIIRSEEVATITPKLITLADVNNAHENLFVALTDMQFPRSLVFGDFPATFASDDGDEFQGERKLVNCLTEDFIDLSTSTFSNYISNALPNGQGTANGILARDFFDNKYIFKINEPSDVVFENGVDGRCDPPVFNFEFESSTCANTASGSTVVYSEDFESFSDLNPWSTSNLFGGEVNWVLGSFSGSNYAQISGFGSDESDIDVLLVSETFNLDSTTDEKLNFDIQVNFDNGNILTVLISEDYVDDIYAATWVNLNASIPSGPSGGFGSFEAVDTLDVSCFNGDVTLAFLYRGQDPDATTRYHIDNIEVTGN